MKVKRFSKLDTLQDSIKIVSKKTGESLTINRFKSLEVTPTAPGQNEWVKRVKTNGQARWENNGLYIPGFEKL